MGYRDTRSTYRIAINNTIKIYRDVCFKICPEMGPLYANPVTNEPTQQKVVEINDDSSEQVSEDGTSGSGVE